MYMQYVYVVLNEREREREGVVCVRMMMGVSHHKKSLFIIQSREMMEMSEMCVRVVIHTTYRYYLL